MIADEVFSVDLLQNAKQHISFLKGLHSLGVTIRPTSLESFERYRDQWLPMVANYSSESNHDFHRSLIPPPDIAWLFHCHRLAPFRYASYCRQTFRAVHNRAYRPFSFQSLSSSSEMIVHCGTETEAQITRALWSDLYPDEPFFLNEDNAKEKQEKETTESNHSEEFLDGFDLRGSTDRQSAFLWQVSGPLFSNDRFLKDGIERYHKFILLRRKANDKNNNKNNKIAIVVPTYQIDLMWHTHILSSLAMYHRDCRSLLGDRSSLNHDDGLNDRSEGGTLDVAFNETKALWNTMYSQEYSVCGGMYRGEPPREYFSPTWNNRVTGDYLPLVGIHGASSTNPVENEEEQIIWTWRESKCQMHTHTTDVIVGHEDNCWIKYDTLSNERLEHEFRDSGGEGSCKLANRYIVFFETMKQTTIATGQKRDVCRHVGNAATIKLHRKWTPVTGRTPFGNRGFIKAQEKSTSIRHNANPKRSDYVFGRKGTNLGYFHITTKEAYEVLENRVMVHEQRQESCIAMVQCCTLGLCNNSPKTKEREADLQKLQDVRLICKERAKASGLDGDVSGLPARFKNSNQHFAPNGTWLVPEAYYTAGGGCGYMAYSGGGGACGAGACGGGGGCGAGGCGGGGCGGGGCGGGGCGG